METSCENGPEICGRKHLGRRLDSWEVFCKWTRVHADAGRAFPASVGRTSIRGRTPLVSCVRIEGLSSNTDPGGRLCFHRQTRTAEVKKHTLALLERQH